MKPTHIAERLKDRRAYRQALIHRKEEIEAKISRTEDEIKALTKSTAQAA